MLRPGERRSSTLVLRRGSRLRFALGFGPEPPDRGVLVFEVRLDGKTIARRRLFAGGANRDRWLEVTVPLVAEGPVRLEMGGEHRRKSGELVRHGPDERPWIVVGFPRIEARATGKRRVLLWISQDTVRADHLGPYGYARPTTPSFDRLARDWIVHDNAVSTASWTLPSLVSQFTSRYPSFHGAVRDDAVRDRAQPTLFQELAAHGFTVLGVTGNVFVSPHFGTADGFDALESTDGPAEEIDRLAAEVLDQWGGGDLALFVHYMDPHWPYRAPGRYRELFDPGYRGRVTGGNFPWLPVRNLAPADVEHVKALYDGELRYTDHAIGVLLEAVGARGILGDALIVYSADHGEELLDHGGWTHSRTLYREMLHVPLAFRVPGLSGRRVSQMVSLVDLAPTVLDAFGIPRPATFQGRSLLPLLRGDRIPELPAFAETERTLDGNLRVAGRQERLKCVLTVRPDGAVRPAVLGRECYDLGADPTEQAPLGASAAVGSLERRTLAYLARARTESKASRRAALPPQLVEKLRALGYLQ